jgi:PAS domain S-box-containing protein/diguanylate cyclase (GGDEF)-like protein
MLLALHYRYHQCKFQVRAMRNPAALIGDGTMTITQERTRPGDRTILVVEDSPTQAQHLARLLGEEPGWRVRVAADGNAALAAVRAERPDLVISDIAMPGMDGFTLCRTLKDDPALAAMPVLLLTRLRTLQDIVRGLQAGADAFVRKPYEAADLRARARRLLRQGGQDGTQGLELMAAERRQIYELLTSAHDDTLRMNAALADKQHVLERSVQSLVVLSAIAGALNEAMTEAAVAQAATEHLAQLPGIAGVGLSVFEPDGARRLLAARGLGDGAAAQALAAPGMLHLVLPQAGGSAAPGGVLHVLPCAPMRDDLRTLLDGVTRQIAPALERARLYACMEALVVERTEALRSERNRLSAVVETAGALVLLADPAGRIVMFNRACEEALGWPAAEAIGRPCWEVLRGAEDEHVLQRLFEEIAAGRLPARVQGGFRTRAGGVRSIVWTHTRLESADGSIEYVLGTGIDTTELRGAEERLRYVSNFDTLTGLPNRMLLRDRLRQMRAQATASGQVLGFMLLRFVRMPLIRETLGPNADQVLVQQAGARLREIGSDDAVARFSDGSFVLAALRPDCDALAAAARRLLAALGAPYVYGSEELHMDPCVGIAVFPNDGSEYEILVSSAEAAQRQAADGVLQRYAFYRPELNSGANDRFRMETALRRAVDRNELVLHYQPQVALASGIMVGTEALLRWNHPERGLVPPGAFIALAEESGLILPIGTWVLMTACAQIRDWQEAGLPVVPVSVNLSVYQFSDEIVGTVKFILDAYGVDPALLELELTESASMADAGKSYELLAQLKAMGIRLAIDDFGTGYSNLNYLKRFPVDKLKLDKSFVDDIMEEGDDRAISQAVIAMAHGLRLTVVAEGVETAGQLALLAGMGCDIVQGFYYSCAVPPEVFARMLVDGCGPGGVPLATRAPP